MPQQANPEILYHGQHLLMVRRGPWEYATRKNDRPAVGILAITEAREIVLVEQFRPPVNQRVVELPAGLVGDIVGNEDEPLLEAARRELLEETGYQAKRWKQLGLAYSSPGLTDESIVLFLAEGLEKHHAGGGDESEDIVIHEVPLGQVAEWIADKGFAADMKLLAGLYLVQEEID